MHHQKTSSVRANGPQPMAGKSMITSLFIGAAFTLVLCRADAKTLCVDRSGHGACYSSIGAAITAASAGDTVQVSPGTYKEAVTITQSISIVGSNRENTTIDATGQPNGINVNGHDHPNLRNIVISGLTVQNANFAGIAVSNASAVTISDNNVVNNDKGLVVSGASPTCPNLPSYFQAGEDLDCGEGIFLSGVDHSTVARNNVSRNAGGILITDDTGAGHDNVISDNAVTFNQPDCGITLPSHSGAGVYHNTVTGNESISNGGAGVGIFAPGPGSKTYGNVIVNNTLKGNAQPGVTMHNHAAAGINGVPAGAPPTVFDDNVIIGNTISGNAADLADAATPGPTGINIYSVAPMSGTLIVQNTFSQEIFDVIVKVPLASADSGPQTQIHLNDFEAHDTGVSNLGTAKIDATQNWWGCPAGPGERGCATVSGDAITVNPWLSRPLPHGRGRDW